MKSMKTKSSITSIASASAIMLLLLGGAYFAYASPSHLAASPNHSPGPLDESEHSTKSTENHSTDSKETHTSKEAVQTGSEHDSEDSTLNENNQTASEHNNQTGSDEKDVAEAPNHEISFAVIPLGTSVAGRGNATIDVSGLTLGVDVLLRHANATTHYDISISVNGTSHKIGTLVTDAQGAGDVEGEFVATGPGTYQIGILVSVNGSPVLKSDPATQTVTLSHPALTSSTEESDESQKGESQNTNATVHEGDHNNDNEISKAVKENTIPAVIQLGSSGATVSVTDTRFSVSVGKLENDGISVSISAANVTGSRILLVNLTGSKLGNLADHTLFVTYDGKQIVEAASVAQILSPLPTDPARYIIVSTTSGVQLLVSIPHFSTHTIQVLSSAFSHPIIPTTSFLVANSSILLISLLTISAIFAAVYAKRRVYSAKV